MTVTPATATAGRGFQFNVTLPHAVSVLGSGSSVVASQAAALGPVSVSTATPVVAILAASAGTDGFGLNLLRGEFEVASTIVTASGRSPVDLSLFTPGSVGGNATLDPSLDGLLLLTPEIEAWGRFSVWSAYEAEGLSATVVGIHTVAADIEVL